MHIKYGKRSDTMKFKYKNFMAKYLLFFYVLIFIFLVFSGCAVFRDFGTSSGINYALAKNGATVTASNYTPGRNLYSVINGITSSEDWDNGEGWEARFTRRRPDSVGWNRLDPRSKMEYGSEWLEVQFSGDKIINRIVIYPLNSQKYPVSRYGIKEAWIQIWKANGWTTIGEIQGGLIVATRGIERKPAGERIEFKFEPTKTDKIRVVVFQSNDVEAVGGGWTSDIKTENSVARIVEIEALGTQSAPTKEQKFVKSAPDFNLQDINGQWTKLSNYKGKIVIVTFWASWSPESQSQINDLSNLYNQYLNEKVVIIGISTDEGGTERIKDFVQSRGLRYPILIADTGVKSAYGGIGKLPTTFVIDQNGNIFKEYTGYKGGHLIDLDIKKLLQNNENSLLEDND
ncbi:TPA: TlpA family protein disulfide reductase [bacterium]|nr:TlpA family protein disulfide reductase [bacterium]